ncbi:MAG: hypothetical protein ACREIA_15020 [Opitutaceae bacterium]
MLNWLSGIALVFSLTLSFGLPPEILGAAVAGCGGWLLWRMFATLVKPLP